MQYVSCLGARKVGRSLSKQGYQNLAAVETGLEAGCADDMPEVYKIPMVRMSLRLTKPRMNGSRRMGGRNAAAV